jgi:hypothetical protein
MSEQQNLEVVRRGYEAFGRGDMEALLALFDANIEWISPGPPELPIAGTRRGVQQVSEFFGALDSIVEIQNFDPHTFIADGERVVVLGRDRTRVKATGVTLDGEWAHVFTIRDGKVVRMQEYTDTAALVAALQGAHARS